MAELQPGDVFAGHRIEGIAGRGGMGIVYRATQLDLDRPVALKLISAALADDAGFRERFIRESRVAASIDHPNVIPVYYAGEGDGERLYIAMRYVAGDDLRTLVRREGPLPATRAAQIVAQVGAALDAAHARGIVHRDVKPANVLLGASDHPYLTDFGLTKRMASISGQTKAGGWVGTLGYVAPEQIRGERVDARADVYALGCVLFHALTGKVPYARESDEATLWAHLHDPPPQVGDSVSGVPEDFEEVIGRALAKEPDDRFLSAGDLGRAALAAAGRPVAPAPERIVATGAAAPEGESTVGSPSRAPTAAVGAGAPQVKVRRTTPRPGVWIGALVVLLAALGAGIVALSSGSSPRKAASSTTGVQSPPSTATSAAVAPVKLATTVPAGLRPNALVVTAQRAWVGSFKTQALTVVDARTNLRRPNGPGVGIGTQALTAGFGKVWVAKGVTNNVLRIDLAGGHRSGPAIALPADSGQPVAIAAGERGIWVGSRAKRSSGKDDSITRIDPQTGVRVLTLDYKPGVQTLAVGAGAVWVVSRTQPLVTRIDVRTGSKRTISVGTKPSGIAIGDGSVWVTNSGDNTVDQISTKPPFGVVQTIRAGDTPNGIDVGGGEVWVANYLGNSLTRINAKTGALLQRDVPVGANPKVVSVHGHSVWTTLQGAQSVARIDF